MATIEFNADDFRAQFPNQFPDPPNTDVFIELFWNSAICYISNEDDGSITGACRRQLLNLMTAHLITVANKTTDGEQAAFVKSATIDKITVTVQEFENKNQLQTFLNQTPYGQQVYALLYARTVGGFYFGGSNELGSFRRAGGVFFPR